MRRWRLTDGGVLAESPHLDAQYYRLDRDHQVDREYKAEVTKVDDETHRISFIVLDRHLMCRHQVEKPRKDTVDQSKVELADLELLMPEERPTSREVKEAVAVFRDGADAVEQAKLARIEKLVSSAAPSMRDVVGRLAERVVRHDDERARAMMGCLGSLAKVHREGKGDAESRRQATAAITLSARLLTSDPEAKAGPQPGFVESPTLALIDALESLRQGMIGRSEHDATVAALRVAIYHLLGGLEIR